MNTHLDTRAFTLAGAGAGALIALVCFAIYAIVGQPDPWMPLFIGSGPTFGGWLIGNVESALVGALGCAVVSAIYNRAVRTT